MAARWLLKQLFLPPAPMILALLIALLIWSWRPRAARALVLLATLLLWATSAPVVVDPLMRWWQDLPPASLSTVSGSQAIVILGGGRVGNAREWDQQDQVNRHTLIRLRYGAHLARETGLPVLLSAGGWSTDRASEAQLMQKALAEWGVSARWLEAQSLTTWENAFKSAALLRPQGITQITLVTQAFHMRRAKAVFEMAGFEVLTAATDYRESYLTRQSALSGVSQWLPRDYSARDMHRIVHEMLGLGVYYLKSIMSNL